MAVVALHELKALLPKGGRVLGIDQSRAALGLALSDPSLAFATPFKVIRRTKFAEDAKALIMLIREYHVGALVIGLPLNMDGSEGPRTDSVRHFADNFLKVMDIPVAFADERLSTYDAEEKVGKRSAHIDAIAAQTILQDALETIRASAPKA